MLILKYIGKTRYKLTQIIFLASVGFASSSSLAQSSKNSDEYLPAVTVDSRHIVNHSEYKPHFGLLAGFATVEGSYDNGLEYGISYGYQPYIPIGVGFELSSAKSNSSNQSQSSDFSRTKLLIQGSYHFGGHIPIISKTYVGIATGPMIESYGGETKLEIGLMPTIGFDIPIRMMSGKDISFGLNTRYLVSSSGVPDAFGLNAMAKYWF